MSEPTNLEVFRGKKKDPCVYCGKDPHPVPLACPRISTIYICTETGCVEGIEFRESFNLATPDPAA